MELTGSETLSDAAFFKLVALQDACSRSIGRSAASLVEAKSGIKLMEGDERRQQQTSGAVTLGALCRSCRDRQLCESGAVSPPVQIAIVQEIATSSFLGNVSV